MQSYLNYKIKQFLIESYDGSSIIDVTQCVSSVQYYEDLFSPAIFVSILLVDTEGILTRLTNKNSSMQPGIKGGERVSLEIEQPATGQLIKLDETKNTYYIYKVYASTTESTREALIVELCPAEVFKNETSRVIRKYKGNIKDSVSTILKDVLQTTNYNEKNIEPTSNSYVFYGNIKRPFTVLTWLCPKSIPAAISNTTSSSPTQGTAGYLFYQNKEGFNFKSIDTLMSGFEANTANKKNIIKYVYKARTDVAADPNSNFKVLTVPVFEKNVNIMENLRIGMYSSLNYFFDIDGRKFYEHTYTLKDSYKLMDHASSSNVTPPVPLELDSKEHPSRLMVRILDNYNSDPANTSRESALNNEDKTPLYQAASLSRYNLAFSQKLNITVPLNLNLTVGDIIELDFGTITKSESERGTKDQLKSGYYLIKELSHLFEQNQGYTGLKLIRDSYGAPPQ
jgi:hypothetical protein